MKIYNAIVCDEVRKEDNGKHIILGVYPIDVLVTDIPTIISLVLWMQLYMERNGQFDVEFQIRKDKTIISRYKATMNVIDHLLPQTFTLPHKYRYPLESRLR